MNRLFKLRQSIKYLPNSTVDLLKALFPLFPLPPSRFPVFSQTGPYIASISLYSSLIFKKEGKCTYDDARVSRWKTRRRARYREGGKAGGETGGDLGAKTDPFPRADNQLRRFLEEKCRARTYADSWRKLGRTNNTVPLSRNGR